MSIVSVFISCHGTEITDIGEQYQFSLPTDNITIYSCAGRLGCDAFDQGTMTICHQIVKEELELSECHTWEDSINCMRRVQQRFNPIYSKAMLTSDADFVNVCPIYFENKDNQFSKWWLNVVKSVLRAKNECRFNRHGLIRRPFFDKMYSWHNFGGPEFVVQTDTGIVPDHGKDRVVVYQTINSPFPLLKDSFLFGKPYSETTGNYHPNAVLPLNQPNFKLSDIVHHLHQIGFEFVNIYEFSCRAATKPENITDDILRFENNVRFLF